MSFVTIFDYFEKQLNERADAPAYFHSTGTLTFAQLHERAARLAGALTSFGIRPGDRIAMVMPDSPDLIVSILAIMGVGGIAVPCNTLLSPADLTYVLNNSGARVVVTTSGHLGTLMSVRPNLPHLEALIGSMEGAREGAIHFEQFLNSAGKVDLAAKDKPAFIVYTSGSTGRPKGALHHHADVACSIESMGRVIYEITPEDRLFSGPRLSFAYGFANSLAFPLGLGAPCALLSDRPLPAAVAQIFKDYRPTIFFGVPAIFRNILEYVRGGGEFDPGDLKLNAAGGENLPPQTFNEWKALTGTPILETIGSTELLHGYLSNQKNRIKLGSSGLAAPGYEIKLVDDEGRAGERGILHVKGGSAFHGYWDEPAKTAETLRDGWVVTGDIYRRDNEGFYYFEGRADDMFKSSGNWVSPVDVEDVLRAHPAVSDVAVVGLPAIDGAFEVTAFISLRPDSSPEQTVIAELNDAAEKSLPRYKRPKSIRVLAELPRNATGKVLRFKLRAMSGQQTQSTA